MFGTERLRKVLDIILSTGQVLNGEAVSAVLIAGSDAGKSQLVLERVPRGARILNDFHYATILPMLNEKDPPKRIIIPDFNMVLAHRPVVTTLTCAMLLGLMAEGLQEIPGLDGRSKISVDNLKGRGIKLALLTAMTPDMFRAKRGKWRSTGFLRRLLPIYYRYSSSTVEKIQDWIGGQHVHTEYRGMELALPPAGNVAVKRPYIQLIKQKADQTRKDHLV